MHTPSATTSESDVKWSTGLQVFHPEIKVISTCFINSIVLGRARIKHATQGSVAIFPSPLRISRNIKRLAQRMR
jgi:hypothetical protein